MLAFRAEYRYASRMKPHSASKSPFSTLPAEAAAVIGANAPAGIILWTFGLSLVLSYYFVPGMADSLAGLAEFKTRTGFLFSAFASALAGGILPCVILWLSPKTRDSVTLPVVAFAVIHWAYRGMEVDLLYRMQALVFGDRVAWEVIIPKVCVDQFGYTALWAVPTQYLLYKWRDSGFRKSAFLLVKNPDFLRHDVPLAVVSTWSVWIPSVIIVYSLPLPLQVPLFNIVLAFYVLILNALAAKGKAA